MDNPFKLLDSYNEAEAEIFFGRDMEIASLYNLLQKTRLVLLYGASGTGKTSLIHAGMPKAFKLSEWLCISVRRKDNINDSFNNELKKATGRDVASQSEAILSIFEKRWMPIYLVFDQFEEIFTLGQPEEIRSFFQNLQKILDEELPCKVILSMREEYIGHLYEYEKFIPQLFDHRFRVEAMKDDTVCMVVKNLCGTYGIGMEEETIPRLILKQIKEGKQSAYLPYLQIYLYSLYEKAEHRDPITFTGKLIDELGTLDKVLKPFITSKEEDAQQYLSKKYPNVPPDFAAKVLDEFSTEDGTKKPQKVSEIVTVLHQEEIIVRDALQYFHDNSKLLRIDEDNTERYELMHDILARLIYELRSTENKEWKQFLLQFQRDHNRWESEGENPSRLLTIEDVAKAKLYEERLKARNFEEYTNRWLPYIQFSQIYNQNKKTRARIVLFAISAIAIIAIVSGAYAFIERNKSARIVYNTDFYKGLALAIDKKSGKYGYMDTEGKISINFLYEEATPFNRSDNYLYGYARVKRDNSTYLLDVNGVEYKIANTEFEIKDDVTILDMTEKNVTEIPVAVWRNPQIKILLLRGNEITAIPDSISKMIDLEFVDLSENLIDSIPQALSNLPKLQRLGLAWNPIAKIPEFISNLERLQFLDISYCMLESLPHNFSRLNNLNTLYISGNNFHENIEVLKQMPIVKIIDTPLDTGDYKIDIPEMVFVKGGTFQMGKSAYTGKPYKGRDHELPVHEVRLSDFYIGKYEVTQAFWKSVMKRNPSAKEGCDQCPVDKVSWYHAQKFLYRLNKLKGRHFRLPTEAEWEFAARGGYKNDSYAYAGSNDIDSVAWYFYEKTNGPHAVGTKRPNGLGIYDMSGNVWEWCEDTFDSTFYKKCYDMGTVVNPICKEPSKYGIYRGGDWFNAEPHFCLVNFRGPSFRSNFSRQLGFRIASGN